MTRFALALGGLTLLLLTPACDSPRAAGPPAPPAGVIVISLDTTRADHLGCYGATELRTPHIDAWAASGVLFEQCATVAPLTLPANASLLTGLYPFQHGVRNNGLFALPETADTLAERFATRGYQTAAFIAAAVVNREFGLAQGFQTYDDVRERGDGLAPPERSAQAVIDDALAWLRDRPNAPFFLFIHLFDPHMPYRPPPEFEAAYPGRPYLAEIAYVDAQLGRLRAALDETGLAQNTLVVLTADHGESLGAHGELTHGTFVYDDTMRVPLLFSWPAALPAGRRVASQVRLVDVAPTLLQLCGLDVLSAADGQTLTPLLRGATEQSRLAYGESLYAKLALDLAPLRMVRDGDWKYIHAPQPELYDLRSDPREENDLAAAQPQRVAEFRAALEKLVRAARPLDSAAATIDPRQQRELSALGYLGASGGGAALLDEADLLRAEGRNPRQYARQIRTLHQVEGLINVGQFSVAERALSAIVQEEGDAGPALPLVHAQLAVTKAAQGRTADALPHFELALRGMPDDARTRMQYGVTLLRAGRTADAVHELETCVDAPSTQAAAREWLALAHLHAGRREEAAAALRGGDVAPRATRLREVAAGFGLTAPALDGEWDWRLLLADAARELGENELFAQLVDEPDAGAIAAALAADAALEAGDSPRARAALERLTQAAPRSRRGWTWLGALRFLNREDEAALAALRMAHSIDAADPETCVALARVLATSSVDALRDGAEAVRLARAAEIHFGASDPQVHETLAAALAETGDFDAALAALRRGQQLAESLGEKQTLARLAEHAKLYAERKPLRRP